MFELDLWSKIAGKIERIAGGLGSQDVFVRSRLTYSEVRSAFDQNLIARVVSFPQDAQMSITHSLRNGAVPVRVVPVRRIILMAGIWKSQPHPQTALMDKI
jgi:hypothetical protein